MAIFTPLLFSLYFSRFINSSGNIFTHMYSLINCAASSYDTIKFKTRLQTSWYNYLEQLIMWKSKISVLFDKDMTYSNIGRLIPYVGLLIADADRNFWILLIYCMCASLATTCHHSQPINIECFNFLYQIAYY